MLGKTSGDDIWPNERVVNLVLSRQTPSQQRPRAKCRTNTSTEFLKINYGGIVNLDRCVLNSPETHKFNAYYMHSNPDHIKLIFFCASSQQFQVVWRSMIN